MPTHESLYQRAQQVIPGGVNSPVRAFNGVGGTPIFFQYANGAYIIDETEKHYIDYVGSWGPMVLGHNHPDVIAAVHEQLDRAMSFGAPTVVEIELAEKITQLMPSIDMVRLVNSGTEATMSAIRLARGFTGRDKIIKFAGCYHGHSDSLLVKAGSGALTLGVPSSPGVPASVAEQTLTAHFNDLASVETLFAEHGPDIAAIIVEPIAGNMGCIPPKPDFLSGLRDLCDQHRSLLIFDEVMTGFRVALGGATSRYGVTPDLMTLGKVIGGGLPVGAFGGKRKIMEAIAPVGPVYQAGTLSGNPLAVTAGLATLNVVSQPGFYENLEANTKQLVEGLVARAESADIPVTSNQVGSMFSLFFTDAEQVQDFDAVQTCNIEHYKQFFHGMLDKGIYFAPSAFETSFVSGAHLDEEIELTLNAAEVVFESLNAELNK